MLETKVHEKNVQRVFFTIFVFFLLFLVFLGLQDAYASTGGTAFKKANDYFTATAGGIGGALLGGFIGFNAYSESKGVKGILTGIGCGMAGAYLLPIIGSVYTALI